MDVGEVLKYQPEKPGPPSKRRHDDLDFDDFPVETAPRKKGLSEEDRQRILKMVDEEPETEALDGGTLKRLILQFEKRVYKNQEMRIKYPDMPEKFMESEVELNDTIQEMHVIATVPHLYHILVELNAVRSLLGLLSHENTDISIAVVDLLQEMTDVDSLTENDEGADALIDALLEGQVVALLIQNLDRLDEAVKEEADGVHNTLGIIENMTDLRQDVCLEATQQGLMQWLLKRMKAKMPFDGNKLYCSEVLAILLQNQEAITVIGLVYEKVIALITFEFITGDPELALIKNIIENRKLLGELDGIDVLLQQLATYKRHDPVTQEEVELMENLFNCLCSALMLDGNRDKFLRGEGLQLMNLMLREKKMSRLSAIKVLDHAMTGAEGVDNCHKFVDILGLRSIFPLFMKTPKRNKKAGPAMQEMEEHIVSIIASMMKNCQGTQRQRLINKFAENDHEKVDRLVELHFKYQRKLRNVDDKIESEKHSLKVYGDGVDEETEEKFYMQRLDAGLFTLQLIDYIMLEICCTGPSSVKQRVMQILNMRGGSIKAIRSIMREYAGNIGDKSDPEQQEKEQNRILSLLDKF